MATRAERFRAEMERSGPKRPKQSNRSKRKGLQPEQFDGLSGRQLPADVAAPRHHKRAAAKKAPYALEPTPLAARPSRKSTRRAGQHLKAAVPLRARVEREVSSPRHRHDGRGG